MRELVVSFPITHSLGVREAAQGQPGVHGTFSPLLEVLTGRKDVTHLGHFAIVEWAQMRFYREAHRVKRCCD